MRDGERVVMEISIEPREVEVKGPTTAIDGAPDTWGIKPLGSLPTKNHNFIMGRINPMTQGLNKDKCLDLWEEESTMVGEDVSSPLKIYILCADFLTSLGFPRLLSRQYTRRGHRRYESHTDVADGVLVVTTITATNIVIVTIEVAEYSSAIRV
ncbi:hypothetical protein TWF506_007751 [Arthrobotrys conoides]|uniref:Uncharacterized protein n=1 Tax=Arthrobotrys conoides TaxID=74498 RepID=A0AAN8RY88_9PEZI